jgi:hypothetical protein
MIIKVFATVAILGVALFGFQQLKSTRNLEDSLIRGKAAVAAEDAKAKGQREVKLSAPIAYYAQVNSLDDALANYTTLIARPISQHSQISPSSKQIETSYKLEVIDFLSKPKATKKCTHCPFAKAIPSELQPVQGNEVVVVRNTGTVVLDGVKVTSSDKEFPDFKLNQKYLFFLLLDLNTRVGFIDLGQAGVSVVESDGQVSPVSANFGKLSKELRTRFGKINQIKTGLQSRRFPE